MRKVRWGLMSLAVVACLGWPSAWAASSWGEEKPAKGVDRVDDLMRRYNVAPAFSKLGRGVSNLLLGWTEIPLNVGKWYTQSDTMGSALTGAAVGIFKGAVRTGVGAFETVTFFVPYPEHYAPVLPTLEYFQKDTNRKELLLE